MRVCGADRRELAGVWLLAALWLLAGCGDSTRAPSLDCSGVSGLPTCDIRQEACQRDVLTATACARGGNVTMPPVSVLTPEQYQERIGSYYETPDERSEAWIRGLALLHLMPLDWSTGEEVEMATVTTAAAYFSDSEEIVVIDRGEPLDDESAVFVLSHEMVHALQDGQLDLMRFDAMHGTSFDRWLAAEALIEGEAIHYSNIASALGRGVDPDRVDWEGYYQRLEADIREEAVTSPAPFALARQSFPYAYGGSYVTDAWLERGDAGVRELYDDVPVSTAQVMTGYDAAPPGGPAWAMPIGRNEAPLPLEGYERVGEESLGAWLYYIFKHKRSDVAFTPRETEDVLGLTGDRVWVFRGVDSDAVVSVWRLHWTDPALGDDLIASIQASMSVAHDVTTRDGDAVLVASDSPAALRDWVEGLQWGDPDASMDASPGLQPAAWVRSCMGGYGAVVR